MPDDVQIRFGASVGGLIAGVEEAKSSIASIRAPVDDLIAGFRELGEAIGAAFVVDKLADIAREMAELGERAVNTAAAIGTTPEKFVALSSAMRLAGGTADTATRTIERLSRAVQMALAEPTSQQAAAFRAIGVSMDELRDKSNDLTGLLELLADRWSAYADGLNKTAAFSAILGRGMESLIPYLRGGADGIRELNERTRQLGADLDGQTIAALADTRERMNALGVATTGLEERLVAALAPAITAVVGALTAFAAAASRALAGSRDLERGMSGLEVAFRVVIQTVRDVIAIFGLLVHAIALTLDEINQFAQGLTRAVHGITNAIGALARGDIAGMGKAWEAGWQHSAAATAANAASIRAQIEAIKADVQTLFGGGGRAVAAAVVAPARPAVAPLEFGRGAGGRPARGRAGASDRAEEQAIRKEAELFAAGERLKLAAARGNADQIAAIYNEWLAEVAAIYGRDSVQYLNLEREKVEATRRAAEQQARIEQEAAKKAEEYWRQIYRRIAAAAREQQRQIAEAWQRFSGPIARDLSDALTNAVLGIRTRGGLREVMLGLEKSVVGGMMSNLVKGLGDSLVKPLFTGLIGQGGMLGGLANLLLGNPRETTKISLLSIIAANTGATAAAAGATAAATGTSAVTGPLGSLGGGILGGGFFGSVFKGIGSFFTSLFAQGGIVPAAAGGWALPAFAGAVPALLHSREMVLPADIAQGLQGLIRGGGTGEVHVHLGFHGPADGASIGRWFAQNRGALAAAIGEAWNAGALSWP